jgi:hypothetical protein
MRPIENFNNWNRLYESAQANKGIQPINEASVGETLMTMITSAKNAAKIRSKYKKLKQAEYASKLESEQEQLDLEAEKEDALKKYLADAKEKANEGIKQKLDAIPDAAKKKAMGTALRQKRDEQLENLKATFDKRYTAQKDIAKKKADEETKGITAAITELTGLKVDNEYLKKQVQEFRDGIDFDEEIKYMNKSLEQSVAAAEDPDVQARLEQKAAEASKRLKKERATEREAAKQATQGALAAQEAKLASADDRTKESVTKLKDLFDTMNKYQEAADKYISEPDNEDYETAVVDVQKALSDAKDKIGKKVIIDTELGTEDDWEEVQGNLMASADELTDEYKEDLAGVTKKTKKEKKKSAVDVAKEALGDQFDSYQKIDNPEEKEPDTTDANGDTVPGKKKWKDIKRFKGKDAEGADTAEEVIYAKPNDLEVTSYSPNVSGAYQVSESIAARFKRAMDQRGPRF